MHRSIRTNLTLTFIFLAVVPLLVVAAMLNWNSYLAQRRQVLELQHEITKGASAQINDFFRSMENTLQLTTQVSDLRTVAPEAQTMILSSLLFYQNAFDDLIFVDQTGQEQARVSRLQIITRADLQNRINDPAFRMPIETGQTYYGPIRFSDVDGEPLSTIAIPLTNARTGERESVLIATVRLKQVWDVVADIPVGATGTVYIVDENGRVVAHHDPSVVLQQTTLDLAQGDGERLGLADTEVLLSRTPVTFGEHTLYSMAELPIEEAYAPAFRNIATTTTVLLFTLLLAIGLGLFIVRRIVHPIEELAATAQAISAGDLQQQVAVQRNDEIGRLATTFNVMTGRLHQTLSGLEERVQQRTAELEARNTELTTAYQQLQSEQQRAATAEQTVLEMGSPVIPVLPRVLLVPLVGTVTTQRMYQLNDLLLESITAQHARTVLLDITGVPVIDTQVSQMLLQLNQAIMLLGARMILIGVRPEIAQNIVSLGVDLHTIATYATLAEALARLKG